VLFSAAEILFLEQNCVRAQEPSLGHCDVTGCIHAGSAKGPGKREHIVTDTLLPTQMFPCLPARAIFVADTNFVSGTQKMLLILFRNILCPQQMFPRFAQPKKHHEQKCVRGNVSSFARAIKILSCFHLVYSRFLSLPLPELLPPASGLLRKLARC